MSFHQDHLELLKQHGDLETNVQANARTVAKLEARLAWQETRMVNLIQKLERAEVGGLVDLLNRSLNPL